MRLSAGCETYPWQAEYGRGRGSVLIRRRQLGFVRVERATRRCAATLALALLEAGLCLLVVQAHAQDSTPTVVNKSEGNALRLSVVNAVVNYVNNARQAYIDMQWDLLPTSQELLV